jgi:putative hydrolase of the HAD superfamily
LRNGQQPSALIVDFGGVLTTPLEASFAWFCSEYGVSPATVSAVLEAHNNGLDAPGMVQAIERGEITRDEFDAFLAGALFPEPSPAPLALGKGIALSSLLISQIRPVPSMVLAIKAIHQAGVPTALLSNSWGNTYPIEAFAGIFDHVLISGEVGMRKPDPEIYALAARRMGVEPELCVFLDDLAVNVAGAVAAGMTGLRHISPEDSIGTLERLFGVSVPG